MHSRSSGILQRNRRKEYRSSEISSVVSQEINNRGPTPQAGIAAADASHTLCAAATEAKPKATIELENFIFAMFYR